MSNSSTPANSLQIRKNVSTRIRRSDKSLASKVARIRSWKVGHQNKSKRNEILLGVFFRIKECGNVGQNNDDDSISLSSSQRSDGYSTPSSISMSIEDIDENYFPDLYDFEESLTAQRSISDENLRPDLNADSMDTIVNNVDSRSAMALDDWKSKKWNEEKNIEKEKQLFLSLSIVWWSIDWTYCLFAFVFFFCLVHSHRMLIFQEKVEEFSFCFVLLVLRACQINARCLD